MTGRPGELNLGEENISHSGGSKLMHQTKLRIPRGNARRVTQLATLVIAGLAVPALSSAAALNGNLSLSSFGTETIAVNGADIDFDFSGTVSTGFPPVVTSGTVDGTGDGGLFEVTSASTGSFGGALVGTNTTIHDLSETAEPVGSLVGTGLPLASFVTFTAEPGWNITLTEIMPGVFGACTATSVSCTPAGSPFNLTNEGANQVLVGFAFAGTATDGLGNISTVGGTFSTTFSNTTEQAILTDLEAGEAIVSSANATIGVTPVPSVPEPASIYLLLLGGGLLTVSVAYRRYQRR
jgi:hypothetical protein